MGQTKKITSFPFACLSCRSTARNFQVLQIHCTLDVLKNFGINFQAIYWKFSKHVPRYKIIIIIIKV